MKNLHLFIGGGVLLYLASSFTGAEQEKSVKERNQDYQWVEKADAKSVVENKTQNITDSLYDNQITQSFMSSENSQNYPDTFYHTGIDILCNTGDKINAIENGSVVFSGEVKTGYGNVMIVKNDNLLSLYGHLNAMYMPVGHTFNKDEILGECGNTGFSSGSHSHLELLYKGLWVDLDYKEKYDNYREKAIQSCWKWRTGDLDCHSVYEIASKYNVNYFQLLIYNPTENGAKELQTSMNKGNYSLISLATDLGFSRDWMRREQLKLLDGYVEGLGLKKKIINTDINNTAVYRTLNPKLICEAQQGIIKQVKTNYGLKNMICITRAEADRLNASANKYQKDANLIYAQMMIEGYNDVCSYAGACGIAQVIPDGKKDWNGVVVKREILKDKLYSWEFMMFYLAQQGWNNDIEMALSKYNGSCWSEYPRAVATCGETIAYISMIKSLYKEVMIL
jgi:murein DD-endopeptidase MepM/ murein hydrolase activator NlpD